MAVTNLTAKKGNVNKFEVFELTAASVATDGFKFTLPKTTDEYVVVIVENTHASSSYDVTIKAPTSGGYAAASADVKAKIAAGKFAQLRIESARYANNDGTVHIVPENVAIKAALLY